MVVADFFHPIDNFAVEFFLDGDVRHGGSRCGAMPVLLTGREPHNIAGPNLRDRPAFSLSPTAASGDDESLTKWMGVPCRPCARLKSYTGALNESWVRRRKKRIDADSACEPIRGSLGGRL